MSKHTTCPIAAAYNRKSVIKNSHVNDWSNYPVGNWNRHKKRRIDSRLRSKGRRKRYELRHTIDGYYEG